jgi:hypothetical protein
VDQIKITYLQLRFGEKKYLTDANPAYAVEIHSFIPLLKDQIATTANLEPKVKADLLKQIDDYLTAFDALVALDNEVTVHNKELLTAAGAVETQAAKIEELGNQLAADRIASARSNYAQTYTNCRGFGPYNSYFHHILSANYAADQGVDKHRPTDILG